MPTNSIPRAHFVYRSLVSLLLTTSFPMTLSAEQLPRPATEEQTLSYLKSLSIEELLQTQITSVSKKSEQLFTAAAAVTVISQEDIQRAGIRTIMEALRLVPGMQVAQIDGSRYAISSRGFNNFFANKLLVMIDGRSVYTPLFSGVYWNIQDTLIEDIDRIEVIRGPGATVWGANAVNGVINIITKSSNDTQGGFISTTVGSHERPLVSTRYGGEINNDITYRIFAKGFQRDNLDSGDGGDAHDGWESLRAGFRFDMETGGSNTFSLQSEIYDTRAEATSEPFSFKPPYVLQVNETEDYQGGHFLATWQHRQSEASTLDFQFYYDHTDRNQIVAPERRDTLDFEFKHRWNPAGIHDIVWGLGYRWTSDEIDNSFWVSFDPDNRSDDIWSGFIQDDIALIQDQLWLTLGSKFEHNDYSGFEVQPSVRVRFTPDKKQTLWAAVSRAVRTPARADHDLEANFIVGQTGITSPVFGMLRPQGTENFDAEELIAYEIGYRLQPTGNLSFDFAAYYNDYDNLSSINSLIIGTPYPDVYSDGINTYYLLVLPQFIHNGIEAKTYGFELQGTWQAMDNFKITAAYSFIQLDFENKYSMLSISDPLEETITPKHQFQLRGYLDLTHNISLNSELYYVDGLDELGVDSYVRLDLQLSWRPTENLELSVGVENLGNSSHLEYPSRVSYIDIASEIPQQYWLKAVYNF